VVRFHHEKSLRGVINRAIREFSDFISLKELGDLPLQGAPKVREEGITTSHINFPFDIW